MPAYSDDGLDPLSSLALEAPGLALITHVTGLLEMHGTMSLGGLD
jgi:hypothetical protein